MPETGQTSFEGFVVGVVGKPILVFSLIVQADQYSFIYSINIAYIHVYLNNCIQQPEEGQ